MDSYYTFDAQAHNICKVANLHLCTIGSIRRYLTPEATERFVHAFVTSRLDSGNSLLVGLPAAKLSKLQKLQNTAARIVTRTQKLDHITPILKDLHWLPITHRIEYKILLLVYKAANSLAPAYLTDLLVPYKPSRSLRSHDQQLLVVPRTNRHTYGDRAFSKCAPELWNALPLELRESPSIDSFKSNLKTYLFHDAYLE